MAAGTTVVLLAVLLHTSPSGASGTEPVSHPSLVQVDGTMCAACHDDLLEDRAVVHPPASDDCSVCHEVTVADDGTKVAFAETEPALCLMCHDEWTAAVEAELESPHFPVTDSCVTCHDPHASDEPHLLVAPGAEVCTACHDLLDLDAPHGGQLTATTDCATCHQPHGSENPRLLNASRLHRPFDEGSCDACHRKPFGNRMRLRSRGDRLCTACHGDMREGAAEGATVHAALRDYRGRAGCLNCHDPHMSGFAPLLKAGGPDLCRSCHSEVVDSARAETGHAVAADDCLACHQPHVSDEATLLLSPAEELCTMCHDIEDSELVGAHLGADLAGKDCTECHSPHGAGHPTLLARNVHAPLLDGCDTCHEGAWNQLMEDGESPLCLICHDDIGEHADSAEFPHPAMEVARCADCHNPHASAQNKLVKWPAGAVCTECHEDQAAGPGEVSHAIIRLVGCEACHDPHGGDSETLLRKNGDALCLSCHGPNSVPLADGETTVRLMDRFEIAAKDSPTALQLSADNVWGHPILGHRVAGVPTEEVLRRVDTTFDGELSCLICHDPHKGRSSELLQWDAASAMDACLHCHPK
jgi:predicted CXXCH cytochrome family protein